MQDPQHDDHVKRRLYFQQGLLGLIQRPNMTLPQAIIDLVDDHLSRDYAFTGTYCNHELGA